MRRIATLLATIAITIVATFGTTAAQTASSSSIPVQILAFNDFHGNLRAPTGSTGRIGTIDAGGVAQLATQVRALESRNRNSITVSAGDLIGASPLLSAVFHDEPTIEAMNSLGLDLAAVGNHEFDEGAAEVLRMQRGGCHPLDGCQDGDDFGGADFRFLAANVVVAETGRTLLPQVAIRSFEGARIAFVGMTLEGTPQIVTPAGVAGLEFRDEADTVNTLIPALRRRGVDAIVVLLHEGGVPTGGFNECPGISGPIVDIAERLDDAVDVIISGHTHQAYNCTIDGKLVTSAASFGRLVTDVQLTVDRNTDEITSAFANNVIVRRTLQPNRNVSSVVERYESLVAPLAARIVGSVSESLTRTANDAQESVLGDLIADAQLAATAAADRGGAQLSFMNPGGIRTDISFAPSGAEQPGQVTYEEMFTVQPFGNSLVTMTLTGAQVKAVLEQQVFPPAGSPRILQVSKGFTYSYNGTAPAGQRVDPASMKLHGTTLDPAASYRVTVNSFLASGGDGFTVLNDGTDLLGGEVDLDAFEDFLSANSPLGATPRDRITRTG